VLAAGVLAAGALLVEDDKSDDELAGVALVLLSLEVDLAADLLP
jgi:hypothetical protein